MPDDPPTDPPTDPPIDPTSDAPHDAPGDAPGDALNERQREAVATLDGPLLVLAGAGTGKTRVIEARTAALLEAGVAPERILLLTFTRRAAQEMLRRAAARHPQAGKVDGGTFHALAYRLVARHHAALGLPGAPTVLDEDDATAAVRVAMERAGVAQAEKGGKKGGAERERGPRMPRSAALVRAFSRATNVQRPLREILEEDLPDFADQAETIVKVRRAWAAYKIERGYVDYDDLLVMAKVLLDDPARRRTVASAWSHVQVDEYQDVNGLQADIALRLAEDHRNLMVVGDPRQSIYAFRGAQHEAIVRFPERMPGARTIQLTGNYRSTAQVLATVNAVMAGMDGPADEPLASAPGHEGARPVLSVVADDQTAATLVADEVQEHLDDPRGLAPFAVLVRSRHHGLPLQGELMRRRIPFEVRGGLRVTELAHVKDVLAHLRMLHNPYDELAWMRVLTLLEGVGDATAARIFRDATDPEALATTGQADPLLRLRARAATFATKRSRESLESLEKLLDAVGRTGTLLEVFDAVVAHYRPILKRIHDDHRSRADDLDLFRVVVAASNSLGALLADLALDPDAARQERRTGGPSDDGVAPLTISTVHSAKGLEWDHVTVLGVADGDLPSRHALRAAGLAPRAPAPPASSASPTAPTAPATNATEAGDAGGEATAPELEEERRLLYVAATRARRGLSFVHALYGQRWMRPLSRFLSEPAVLATLDRDGPGWARAADADGHDPDGAPRRPGGIARATLLDALAGEDPEEG